MPRSYSSLMLLPARCCPRTRACHYLEWPVIMRRSIERIQTLPQHLRYSFWSSQRSALDEKKSHRAAALLVAFILVKRFYLERSTFRSDIIIILNGTELPNFARQVICSCGCVAQMVYYIQDDWHQGDRLVWWGDGCWISRGNVDR